jgi:signal transduction histidine kinase
MAADSRNERPLDGVASIKVKIGLLVALSIVAAVVVLQVGDRADLPGWLTLPVTLVTALAVTQWLARGMTSPLREMTRAAGRMAGGDYSARVTASSADEVGRLARAFNSMAAELDSVDQQRRELVATVSHELRTPLAAQRALLENLVDGVVTPDDAALQTALMQSERLSGLVADLLDVSRVDGGAVPLVLAPIEVATLLEQAAAEVSVSGHPVRVETSVEPADLVVSGDAARLTQVVVNLLDNAIRHSPARGTVRVRATTVQDRWSLEVSDDGPGLPPDRAAKLFSRFGVGDDSSGGTGLGLAIASWVCELHGGSIRALPPADGASGARVRALLPLRPAPRGESKPGSDADSPPEPTEPLRSEVPTVNPSPPTASASVASGPAVPLPPFIDSLFGDYWPEHGPRTAPLPLYASIAVGALAASVLPYRSFGIGTLLVLLVSGGLLVGLSVHRRRVWTTLVVALSLGLVTLVVLRAAEWLAVLAILATAVLVTTSLTDAKRFLPMVASGAAWVLSGVRGLPLLGRTLAATSRHRLLWPVLRTAALSLVALVVFVGLFASGDAVFGSWVAGVLPDVHIADTLVLRAFVWFLVAGVVLAGCYLALNPPRVERISMPPGRPVARAWEWVVPVSVVVGVFLAFLTAQASAMWGGHDFVRRATGLSYADYVHQGFAQLTVATALTLMTIALAVRKAPRRTQRERRLLRVTLGALCALTLVVVASALFRMGVYQQQYGFTVLRVLVDAFEVWLGVIVVLVIVAGVRLSGWWLPRAALVSGAVLLLGIGLANPEAWVARQNIERYQATGKLDLAYLSSLGADATPVVQQGLPADLAACVVSRQHTSQNRDDWLAWNLGRSRAEGVVGNGDSESPSAPCPAISLDYPGN